MAEGPQQIWEGKATAKIKGPNPKQVWSLLEDFCSLNKYLPFVDTCYKLDGVYGQPGLIRYCSSTKENVVKWCHEKLIAVDPLQRCFTYEVVENNIGFASYFATIKVLAISGEDDNGKEGSLIEWAFVADPIEGWTNDGLLTYIDSSVHIMAENIGKALEAKSDH